MTDTALQPLTTETDTESTAHLDDIMGALTPAATERDRDQSGKFVAREIESEDVSDPVAGDTEDDAAPDESQLSGEEEEAEPDDNDPPIDPPHSWTKEQRDAWNALTPAAKQVVLERETARDAEVRRVQNDAAEERKATKAERDAAAQERQQYADNLKSLYQLQAIIDPVLAEGNQTDWVKLSMEDPAGYVQKKAAYDQRVGLMQAVQGEIQRIGQQQAVEMKANYAKRLNEVFPEFADPETGKALKESFVPTLKDVGFTPEEIEMGWGIPHEPRYLKILDKASKYDKIMAERKTIGDKKVAPAPSKTVKPRAADTGPKGKPSSIVALEKRAQQTGNLRDEVDAVMANLMNGPNR